MGLEQRFSGDEYYYEMEETFLERLGELPPLYSAAIIMQLDVLAQEIYEEHRKKKPTKRFGLVAGVVALQNPMFFSCLLYTSPSPRDRQKSRMPSSA